MLTKNNPTYAKASNNSTVNQAGGNIIINQNNYYNNCWHKIDCSFFDKYKNLKKDSVLDYILGASCKWSIIANDKTVPRTIVSEIINNTNSYTVQALLGAGGEGKTTILMQVAYNLYKNGWIVYYHIGKKINLPDEEIFDVNKTIFIVDDIVSISGFDVFLSQIVDNEYKMLFSSRSNEWAVYCDDKSISTRDIHMVETKRISENEAEQFSTYIVSNSNTTMTQEEIKDIFINKNNGFLYSAMLCSVYGKNLEEIAKNIISRIYNKNIEIAKVLACICMVEETDKKMSFAIYNELYRKYKIPKYEICNCLAKEIKVVNCNYVETRHSIISELFSNYLYKDGNSFFDEYEIWKILFEIYHMPSWGRKFDKSDFEAIRVGLLKICIKENLYEESELLRYLLDSSTSHTCMLLFINHIKILDSKRACEYIKEILTYRKYSNSPSLWQIWAHYEFKCNNIGTVETEYTMRWILKHATESCPNHFNLWLYWAGLEIMQHNIGNVEQEYTARWILKHSAEIYKDNFKLWSTWAKLEIQQGNIGDVYKQNSARWIFKNFVEKYGEDYHLWVEWAKLEFELSNFGEVEKVYSARWIINEAYKKSQEFADIWDGLEKYEHTSKSKLYKTIKTLKQLSL